MDKQVNENKNVPSRNNFSLNDYRKLQQQKFERSKLDEKNKNTSPQQKRKKSPRRRKNESSGETSNIRKTGGGVLRRRRRRADGGKVITIQKLQENAQRRNERFRNFRFTGIDEMSRNTEPYQNEKWQDFCLRLIKGIEYSPLNCIRAIYTWIQHNIKFDYDSVIEEGEYEKDQSDLDSIFLTGRAIALGQSKLFKAMVDHALPNEKSIDFQLCVGITKMDFKTLIGDGGRLSKHAWNSIIYGGKKRYFDVTNGGSEYFLIPEEEMKELCLELNGEDDEKQKIIEFSNSPCFHPAKFKQKWEMIEEESSEIFKKSNSLNLTLKPKEDDEEVEGEIIKNVTNNNNIMTFQELLNKEKSATEKISFAIPDSNITDFVEARIRYKDDLMWNPSSEDDNIAVETVPLEVIQSLDGKKFSLEVPIIENPFNKKYGVVQFFSNGALVWEYCLIFK